MVQVLDQIFGHGPRGSRRYVRDGLGTFSSPDLASARPRALRLDVASVGGDAFSMAQGQNFLSPAAADLRSIMWSGSRS